MGIHQALLRGGFPPPFWYDATAVPVANLYSSAFGGDKFVARSWNPASGVVRSDDFGATWVSDPSSGSVYESMAYGNGVFIVIGGGNIQRSTDFGDTWSSAAQSGDAIAYSPTQAKWLIVRSGSATFYTSTDDGSSWVTHDGGGGGPAFPLSSTWSGVAWSAGIGKWAVVSTSAGSDTNQAMDSTDGVTFTLRTTPSGPFNGQQLAASNTAFFAPSSGGSGCLYSTNGADWSTFANGIGDNFGDAIAYAFPYWIATNGTDKIYWSRTALENSWRSQTMTGALGSPRSACGGDGKYFVTRDGAPYIHLGHVV